MTFSTHLNLFRVGTLEISSLYVIIHTLLAYPTYLWKAYLYLLSSKGTKSIISMYSAWGSKPHSLTWKVGNILLPAFVTIISVPKEWNSSQRGFISSNAPAVLNAGDTEVILEKGKRIDFFVVFYLNWFPLMLTTYQDSWTL